MVDLVVTCPKWFWLEWIAEGDPAGVAQWSGTEWGWYMSGRRPPIEPGDRLYIVAWGRLRGWAPVTRLTVHVWGGDTGYVDAAGCPDVTRSDWAICRHGGANAVTIPEPIPGFQSWRKRWWDRSAEVEFREWQTEGCSIKRKRAA